MPPLISRAAGDVQAADVWPGILRPARIFPSAPPPGIAGGDCSNRLYRGGHSLEVIPSEQNLPRTPN